MGTESSIGAKKEDQGNKHSDSFILLFRIAFIFGHIYLRNVSNITTLFSKILHDYMTNHY